MKHSIFVILLFFSALGYAQIQTIKGSFPQLKGNEVLLKGYDGFNEKELSKTQCDSMGRFSLTYPMSYTGAAMLQIKDAKSVTLLLNKESFDIQWSNMEDYNTLSFAHSTENDALSKGIEVHQQAEQKLAGLNYLLPLYKMQAEKYQWLTQEIAVHEKLFQQYIDNLPATSYAAYYLKTRKFVTDMGQSAKKDNGRTVQHEAYFKTLNFNDNRLWHSGLASELLAGIYQLLATSEDTNKSLTHINAATDSWIKSLSTNTLKQQEVAEFCFKMLEQRNLVGSSEYIAKAMLNQSDCQMDEKRTNLFEQYRKMALGSTAPDIELTNGLKLSKINKKYKLVVFGASECPNCKSDYPSLSGYYRNTKDKYDIEFVYISLDTDSKKFDEFYKEAPFITYCDTKGWESKAVKDYYIFATPSYFLLNKELKIIAKIKN